MPAAFSAGGKAGAMSPQAGRYAPSSADTAVPTGLSAMTPAGWSGLGASRLRARSSSRSRVNARLRACGRASSTGIDARIDVGATLGADAHILRMNARDGKRQPGGGRGGNQQRSPHDTFPPSLPQPTGPGTDGAMYERGVLGSFEASSDA